MSGISGNSSLLDKELEYKRLNAELENKTANLVREAENLLNQTDNLHTSNTRTKLLDNITSEDILIADDEELDRLGLSQTGQRKKHYENSYYGTKHKKKPHCDEIGQDIAQSSAFITDINHELSERVAELEADPNAGEKHIPDVLPTAAQEMSSEAQLRFLKAKVRVSEEETDRLTTEIHKLQEENKKLILKTKEADEERSKALRGTNALQTQLEKYRKLSDEHAARSETLDKQLVALRREMDQLKRQEKQKSGGLQAAEVRLNRALEEVEKAKAEATKARTARKDADDAEKKRADALAADNRRLERQKNDLITAFRKQLKLIDVLKRQRMHLEAAKMLDFTEEEFVKALDWEKN